jgi:hypothetical protein
VAKGLIRRPRVEKNPLTSDDRKRKKESRRDLPRQNARGDRGGTGLTRPDDVAGGAKGRFSSHRRELPET